MYSKRLKYLRERSGLTQKELAEKLEISNTLYCDNENEKQIISSKHLNGLCNIFDVSLDYLFEFTNLLKYDHTSNEIDLKLVGTRLKEVRKTLKITQAKLAKELNTTQSVIAGYESGRYLIATPFIYSICKKYHISADYLLGKIKE